MWDPTQDAWAAGFIDGEGSFVITVSGGGRSRKPALTPRFTIGLRADEAAILRALRDAFGGSRHFGAQPNGSKPRGSLTVSARADMRRLCDYLDRFPLRARKATDYAIWREAVALYEGATYAHEALAEMEALKAALKAARGYVEVHGLRPHVSTRARAVR